MSQRQPRIPVQICEYRVSKLEHTACQAHRYFWTSHPAVRTSSYFEEGGGGGEVKVSHSEKWSKPKFLNIGFVYSSKQEHWVGGKKKALNMRWIPRVRIMSVGGNSGNPVEGNGRSRGHQSIATAGWRGPNPFKRWFGSILPALAKHCGVSVSKTNMRNVLKTLFKKRKLLKTLYTM